MLFRAATDFRRSAWRCWHRARQDRNGSVAVIAAFTAPLLVLALGLGIDVSYWMAVRLQLQRMADLAAMAGAANYASKTTASSALITAANVAELNGLPAASRTTGTSTISENYGVWSANFSTNSSAQLVTVSLQRQVATFFTAAVLTTKPTISVSATAQVVSRSNVGQACVVALQGYSSGVTTSDDLTANGNVDISLSGCDLRADASMVFNGNVTLAVANLIASGTVTMSGNISEPCTQCDNVLKQQPQIPDPFAGTYNAAVTSIPSTTVSQPSGNTLSPPPAGTAYSSLSFNGNNTAAGGNPITFNPGIYYVSGAVSFNGNTTIVGQGVTIISGDGITMNGNTSVDLTAPTSGQTAGLIFGTNASGASVDFNGNSGEVLRGAIYAPNAPVTINGNSDTGAGACLTIVAYSVTFNGNSALSNAGCSSMGVPTASDEPGIARLIQ
jgi:Flp pilus assembly protein TadG